MINQVNIIETLNSLGYIEKKYNGNILIGLYFPENTCIDRKIVLEIAVDLNIAKFEIEAIKKDIHPRIGDIADDPLFPKRFLPLRKKNIIELNQYAPILHCQKPSTHANSKLPVTCLTNLNNISNPQYVFTSLSQGITTPSKCRSSNESISCTSSMNYVLPKVSSDDSSPFTSPHNEDYSFFRGGNVASEEIRVFCHNCGYKLGGSVNFCPFCGANQKLVLRKIDHDIQEKTLEYEYSKAVFNGAHIQNNVQNKSEEKQKEDGWFCGYCTFRNSNLGTNICEICGKTTDRKSTKQPGLKLDERPVVSPRQNNFLENNSSLNTKNPYKDLQDMTKDLERIFYDDYNKVSNGIGTIKSQSISQSTRKKVLPEKEEKEKSDNELTKKKIIQKRDQEERREYEASKMDLDNTEELIKIVQFCNHENYGIIECKLASEVMKTLELDTIVKWLKNQYPQLVKEFREYCRAYFFQSEGLISILHDEAKKILLKAHGKIKLAFQVFLKKREEQVAELQKSYGAITFDEIMIALQQSKGNAKKAKNVLTTKLMLQQDPHFINDLKQPDVKEDYENSFGILKSENFTDELKEYMLMGECKLSWGRANMCLKLIREKEERNIFQCITASRDSFNVHQVRKNLEQECQVCYKDVSVYETITSTHCQCQICWDCYADFLRHNALNADIEALVCPSCQEPKMDEPPRNYFEFIEQQIIDLVRRNKLEKNICEIFGKKLRDYYLKRDPNFCWCTFCDHGFIWDDPSNLQARCNGCGKSFCFKCREEWMPQHSDSSCEEFKTWKEANFADQSGFINNMIGDNILVCPKCNNRFLLARGGCLHFTCSSRACGCQFCLGCFQEMVIVGNEEECPLEARCTQHGLHGHHPRDCFYYLRDFNLEVLQQLLDMHNVYYAVDIPDDKRDEAEKAGHGKCYISTTTATQFGIIDEPCGKKSGEKIAGLCITHYQEYLTYLVNKNHLDPIDIYNKNEILPIFYRHYLEVPQEQQGEDYTTKLRQTLKEVVPLPARKDNQYLPKLI